MTRKGIILAGGTGTRLHPLTIGVSKQLLPVYDKPMIYYPLSVLMLAGIREIAVITTPHDQAAFRRLLGDGSRLGLSLQFIAQPSPDGLAQAYVLAERFLDGAPSAMVLGDNIFFGAGLGTLLGAAAGQNTGARIFVHRVRDPRAYGVVETDAKGRAVSIEEKPAQPRSDLAATGLYFLDGEAPRRARHLAPSTRGEIEITALLQTYLDQGALVVTELGRGFAWFDTGTPDSLSSAADFIRTVETRQGTKIGCIEEIALRQGWIAAPQLARLAAGLVPTAYGAYLADLARASSGTPALREIA